MKNEVFNIPTALGICALLLLCAVASETLYASENNSIQCSALYGEKIISLDKAGRISLRKWESNTRKISSVSSVKTYQNGTSLTKVAYVGSDKYQVHIQDMKSFDDTRDYLTITNQKGHQMTYALNCYSI